MWFWRRYKQYQVAGNNSTNMQMSDGSSLQSVNGIIISNKCGYIDITGYPKLIKRIKMNGKILHENIDNKG